MLPIRQNRSPDELATNFYSEDASSTALPYQSGRLDDDRVRQIPHAADADTTPKRKRGFNTRPRSRFGLA